MAAPKPALKYQLLPNLREMNPGNPAYYYLRLFCEQRGFFFGKDAAPERGKFLSMPLPELAKEKLANYGGSALAQADWAARLDALDWQVEPGVRGGVHDSFTQELGRMGLLASALQVRLRFEIASQRFEKAIGTAKTMLALARHLGDYPTQAANLVGLSIAEQALGSLEEMIQQAGCPNLYWALTDLPCPLVDLRKGFQGDGAFADIELRPLCDDAPLSEDQLGAFVAHVSGELGFVREQAGQPPRNVRAELASQSKDAAYIQAARSRLVEAGVAKDIVAKFPPLQIVLLDEKRDYEVHRDDNLKLLSLTLWQIHALPGDNKTELSSDGLFADLVPRVLCTRQEQGRLELRVALLRHVEALRLYAAGREGKLPEKLTELAVPVPPDPFTGKPLLYHKDGATARLVGGEGQDPSFRVQYELTIQPSY